MSKTIDYYFAVQSPYAYLGSKTLEDIARRTGASIKVRPIDLRAIFPKTGGVPLPKRPPQRQKYRLVELERWRAERQLPLNLQPKFFPVPDELAACLVIAADKAGDGALTLAHALMHAVWAEDRDVSDPETLKDVASSCGLNAEALLRQAASEETRSQYAAYTDEAYERGVFGAPFFFVDDEPFWGQDRLPFVEKAVVD